MDDKDYIPGAWQAELEMVLMRISMSSRAHAELEEICRKYNVSLGEFVGVGCGLASLAYKAIAEGNRIAVIDDRGKPLSTIELKYKPSSI